MPIKIVTVDKKRDSHILELIESYQKRLRAPFLVQWDYLPNSHQTGLQARQDESKSILARINASDFVILLDERGQNIDSPTLAHKLDGQFNHSHPVVFVIGGAYGIDETVAQRADFTWSISHLVFPHQIVRLLLTEQIYRAQSILNGTNYHHE